MTSTQPQPTRPRPDAPSPDRIDLEERAPFIRPIWFESARDLVQKIWRPYTPIPRAERAPSPAESDRVLGHLRDAVTDPLDAFIRWRNEVGDVARLRLGGITAHLVSDPDLIRQILKERHREFVKPIQGRRNLSRVLGNGLLVSEGELWLRQRRISQPAFHKKRIEGFADKMVAAANDVGDEWALRAKRGERFDVTHDMMRLTLRIVQETLLGTEANSDADRIGESVSYLIGEINRRFRRVVMPPEYWPTPANRRFARHRAVLDDAVGAIIRERRSSPERGDDLLSMLIETVDEETGERMDDEQLRDEVMTIFLAGHETTANALSWTFYLLGKHPYIARKMREELDEVLGGRAPKAEDYTSLPYTKMVFSEAMRLYPPAWIVARAPRKDVEIGGYTIEAGTRIFISPWVVHRHPRVWKDPEAFDPERFRDPTAVDPFAYFPFSGGRRMCIGRGFALMEGVLILATLCQRFHLELVPGHRVETQAMVTLRPKHGVRVVAKARSAAGGDAP